MRLFRFLLVTTLAACSGPDSGDVEVDASPSADDAGIDGQVPDTGLVNVIVSGHPGVGQPSQYLADVAVVFYKPDGTAATTVKTDAMGRASAMIEPNSFVAVIKPYPLHYVDVHAAIANPGDTLRFGPPVTSREPNGSVRVSWPRRVVGSYTIYYYVYTSCGYSGETTSNSVTMPLYKGCSTEPFDVVVTSRRSSQEVTGVMSRRGVQATGGLVEVNLAEGGAEWQVGSFTNIELANVPEGTTSTSCTGVQYLGDLAFNSTGSSLCSMRLLPDPQSTWAVEASFVRNSDSRFAVQKRQTFPQTQLGALDASDHLPWITSLAFDPVTRRVTWSSEDDAELDVSALRLEVSQGRSLVWRIVVPNGLPKTFDLPRLPDEYAQWELLPTDVVRASLVNIDYADVTADAVMKVDLHQEDGFHDKVRRGATARTQ